MSEKLLSYLRLSACFLALLSVSHCWASAAPSKASVVINVTLIGQPCIINAGKTIDVDFGDEMLTTQIDGGHYQQTVNYTLDCNNAIASALKMKISGTATGFDRDVLSTSKPDLGISLSSGGRALPLNSWLTFTKGSTPELQMVPVKAPGAKLSAGVFTATATLTVDYQ